MTPMTREPAGLYGAAADAAQSRADAPRLPGIAQGGPMARLARELARELAEAWLRSAQRLATFHGRSGAAGHD